MNKRDWEDLARGIFVIAFVFFFGVFAGRNGTELVTKIAFGFVGVAVFFLIIVVRFIRDDEKLKVIPYWK